MDLKSDPPHGDLLGMQSPALREISLLLLM